MYHYFYRITNGINGKVYYGIHSTDNLDDGYMGSGKLIMKAVKKYGRENFTKDIIMFFDSRNKLSEYEKQFVNEKLINDPNCYNLIRGGVEPDGLIEYSRTHIMVCDINDKDHKIFSVCRDDPKLKSGEYVPAAKIIYKGKVTVRDSNGNCFMVDKNDPRYISGEFVINTKGKCLGMVICKDKNENIYKVNKNDPRLQTGELVGITKGKIPVRDKFGNTILVDKNDPRLQTGELKHNTKGFVTVRNKNGKTMQVSINDPRLQTGELVGITKGMMIVKDNDGNVFQVSKNDPRLQTGELKSNRIGMRWINKDGKLKSVYSEELQNYIDNGWNLGIGNARKKRKTRKI